jgi:hypothetical protein
MFISVFLYLFMGEWIPRTQQDVSTSLQYAFLVVSGSLIVAAIVIRQSTTGQAEEVLRRTPDDAQALARWRSGQIISFVLAESVVLFGFALRFLGAPLGRVLPFYAAGILLFLIFRPTAPS